MTFDDLDELEARLPAERSWTDGQLTTRADTVQIMADSALDAELTDTAIESPVISTVVELADRIAAMHRKGLAAWTVVDKLRTQLCVVANVSVDRTVGVVCEDLGRYVTDHVSGSRLSRSVQHGSLSPTHYDLCGRW